LIAAARGRALTSSLIRASLACFVALSVLAPAAAAGGPPGEKTEESAAAQSEEKAPEPRPSPVEQARALLDEDEFEDALARAREIVEQSPDDAAARVLLADALYRRGDFEESEAAYRKAVETDPNSAAAQFGMGRILRTSGKYGEAAGFFHKAAALDPDNPKYIRTLANHLARREDVIAMLEQYLKMPPVEDERIRKNTAAWVELLKFLGDEPLGEVVRAEPTALALNVLKGQAYLNMNVNRARNQRFAFDTGSTGMTISPRLAKRAKVKRIQPFSITGMGGKGTVQGELVLVREIELGGIALRNVTATIADPKGPEEGLLGPSFFSAFKIRIDLAGGGLSLVPHDKAAPSPASAKLLAFRNVGGQIVVPASLNGTTLNAMVDTGSQSSLASFSAASRIDDLEVLAPSMSSERSFGLAGQIARKTIRTGTFTFAGREVKADGMPCVDLSRFSHVLESEIYFVVGFPELSAFTVGIDYRTNTLELTPRP